MVPCPCAGTWAPPATIGGNVFIYQAAQHEQHGRPRHRQWAVDVALDRRIGAREVAEQPPVGPGPARPRRAGATAPPPPPPARPPPRRPRHSPAHPRGARGARRGGGGGEGGKERNIPIRVALEVTAD